MFSLMLQMHFPAQTDHAHKNPLPSRTNSVIEAAQFTNQMSRSFTPSDSGTSPIPLHNFVDDYIFGRIKRDGIPHASLSSDEEFLRRVYLDTTGLLPSPEVVREFVVRNDPGKRAQLIDALVGSDEFAAQWAWFYGDLFRLTNYAGGSKNAFQFWNKQWLQVDRPYNEVVTDLITGSSKSHSSVPQLAFLGRVLRNSGLKNRDLTDPDNYGATTNRLDALDEISVEIARIFLGINIDCISCHDGAGHLETINLYLAGKTRKEFSQQAAFFGRLRMLGIYNVNNSDSVIDDNASGYQTGNDAPFFTSSETRFPRTGETYEPQFLLTGEKPRRGADPRAEFARMVTSHPQFSRATVNLVWGRLMNVGFVEPYDGFDLARLDPSYPPPGQWAIQPSNPELLESLAEDFRSHGYSMHHLIKTILKSSAYQLSSQFGAEWKDAYAPYYARKFVRVLRGTEIADAIAQATGRPFEIQFAGSEVHRVGQLSDPSDVTYEMTLSGPKGSNEGVEITNILNGFFQNNREAPAPIGNKATTLQAVLLMTSTLVNDRVLAEKGSRVQSLLESSKTDEQVIEELYLATLTRWPEPDEKKAILEAFDLKRDRKRGFQDLAWVLLNGIEFVLNR